METTRTEDEGKRKPFSLCFTKTSIPGRSNILPDKPINLPTIVTPKFYQKPCKYDVNQELMQKYLEQLKVKGPREKYKFSKTENQMYGWYQVQLTDMDRRDRRLNFHKRTDIIVKEHLMNYAKIRE